MDRLRVYQRVAIEFETPKGVEGQAVPCTVVAVDGNEVVLYAHDVGGIPPAPTAWRDVYLVFLHEGRYVVLRGAVSVPDPSGDDLRFWVTDGVGLPRRRSTRHDIALPLFLTPRDRGDEVQAQTINLAPDGALCTAAALPRPEEDVEFRLALSGDDEIHGEARVLRSDGDRAAVAFRHAEQDGRERLKAHLVRACRQAIRGSLERPADPPAELDLAA